MLSMWHEPAPTPSPSLGHANSSVLEETQDARGQRPRTDPGRYGGLRRLRRGLPRPAAWPSTQCRWHPLALAGVALMAARAAGVGRPLAPGLQAALLLLLDGSLRSPAHGADACAVLGVVVTLAVLWLAHGQVLCGCGAADGQAGEARSVRQEACGDVGCSSAALVHGREVADALGVGEMQAPCRQAEDTASETQQLEGPQAPLVPAEGQRTPGATACLRDALLACRLVATAQQRPSRDEQVHPGPCIASASQQVRGTPQHGFQAVTGLLAHAKRTTA